MDTRRTLRSNMGLEKLPKDDPCLAMERLLKSGAELKAACAGKDGDARTLALALYIDDLRDLHQAIVGEENVKFAFWAEPKRS